MVLEAVMISRLVGFALEQMIKRNKKPEIPFSRLMRRATMILIIQNGKEYQAISPYNHFCPLFYVLSFYALSDDSVL